MSTKDIRPDLYLGLVCAAGTDLSELKNQLRAQLSVMGYSCIEIKVSQLLAELVGISPPTDEYARIKLLMRIGDLIRKYSESGHGVAASVVANIRNIRGDEGETSKATAYIIDSLKTPQK